MPRKRKDAIYDREAGVLIRTLAKRVKAERTKQNLSQQELASSARLAMTTIHEIESQKIANITINTVCAIAKALKTDFFSLLKDSKDE